MLKICKKGHQFFKSSDCPTCPICELQCKPKLGFLSKLSAPARRALENNNIHTLEELSRFSEVEILKLHGMGKTSIPKLQKALTDAGLNFKQ
jgi:predicted RecB family nuclease